MLTKADSLIALLDVLQSELYPDDSITETELYAELTQNQSPTLSARILELEASRHSSY